MNIELREIVSFYYSLERNAAGGLLHIVLDDGNMEDSDLDFCEEKCREAKDSLGLFIISVLREQDLLRRQDLFSSSWF